MKLPRPYVPLKIRVQVLRRQALPYNKPEKTISQHWPYKDQIHALLYLLFGDAKVHLDHDPPLMNRTKILNGFGETLCYEPDANDPEYLIYRKVEDHRTKTFIRGDGALRSDMGQRRYLKRVAANRKPKLKFKPRRAKHIRRMPHAPVN